MVISTAAFRVGAADYSGTGGVPPQIVFGFAFLMIMIAIAGASIRSNRANRERAQMSKDTTSQQREALVAKAAADSIREAAIVEAIRREPSLRDASDPASLRRLSTLVEEIEGELRLRMDLDRVRRVEDDRAKWKAEVIEADRKSAERRLAEMRKSDARQAEAERRYAEKKARVEAMPPVLRWVWRNPVKTGLAVGATLVVILVVGMAASSVMSDVRDRAAAETQAQALAEKATADAKAAAEKAAADAQAAAEKATADAKAAAERAAAEKLAADALAVRQASCLAGIKCEVGFTGPGGGIVFWSAGPNEPWGRYLEAAPEVWFWSAGGDPNEVWCDASSLAVAGTKEGIGAGESNTKLLAAVCGSGAANTVSDYAGGGKTDWFLPSKDELNALYNRKSTVGGFSAEGYWSSSQDKAKYAWAQEFTNGGQYFWHKDYVNAVRPVRAF